MNEELVGGKWKRKKKRDIDVVVVVVDDVVVMKCLYAIVSIRNGTECRTFSDMWRGFMV